MIYNIKAIPTQYAGVLFRSRLEARWAAFFDLCEWRWEYEPFDLNGWLPDFRLMGFCDVLVEVKPYFFDNSKGIFDSDLVYENMVDPFVNATLRKMSLAAPSSELLLLCASPLLNPDSTNYGGSTYSDLSLGFLGQHSWDLHEVVSERDKFLREFVFDAIYHDFSHAVPLSFDYENPRKSVNDFATHYGLWQGRMTGVRGKCWGDFGVMKKWNLAGERTRYNPKRLVYA